MQSLHHSVVVVFIKSSTQQRVVYGSANPPTIELSGTARIGTYRTDAIDLLCSALLVHSGRV